MRINGRKEKTVYLIYNGNAKEVLSRMASESVHFAAILVKRGDYETTAYHIPSGADARTASTSGDPKSAGAAAIFFRVTNRPQPVWGPTTTKPA